MAHAEGGFITAEEAREIADRIVEQGRTPEEIKERYKNAGREIEAAANDGRFGVALRVGDDDFPEFSTFIQPLGFTVIQNSTVSTNGPVVVEEPLPDPDNLTAFELIWSQFEYEQNTIEIQRPTGVFLTVRVTSYPLARPLYYSLSGTLVASDFVNNLDEGDLVFDTNGEASIFLNVKTGGARVGKTVQPIVYYDSGRETQLHVFNELTVTV